MISLACGVAIFGFQTRLTRFETSTFHAAIGAAVACRCRHIIIVHLARDRIPIRTDVDDGGRELWEEGTTQVPAKREKLSASLFDIFVVVLLKLSYYVVRILSHFRRRTEEDSGILAYLWLGRSHG